MSDGITDSQNGLQAYLFGTHGRLPKPTQSKDYHMRPFSTISGSTLKEIAQSLLEAKRMARSIENVADTFEPLLDEQDHDTRNALALTRQASRNINDHMQSLYNKIARDAMRQE
jgi:hypothetical protein